MPLGTAGRGAASGIRRRYPTLALLAAAGLFAAGCGPSITVQNQTSIPVRVFVRNGDKSDVLQPSPKESSTMDAEEGAYGVAAVPDQEWIEYGRATRKFLNDQLANSDNLTGPQLLKVVDRLKGVASQIAEFEQAAKIHGAGCGGMIRAESSGALAIVSIAPDGSLVVTCK